MALQLSANRKKAVNRKSCRKILLSSEERKYVQKKVGLLARASLYSENLPDRTSPISGFPRFIHTYSCGNSFGFQPNSLLR